MKRKSRAILRIHRAILETLETRRLLTLAAPVTYPVAGGTASIATGDFNGDGRSDVAATDGGTSISIRLSNADGTLQAAQFVDAGAHSNSIAVGDVNKDGKADIITANAGASADVGVLIGNGNGTFQAPLTTVLPTQFPPGYTGTDALRQYPLSVAVGDLNGDGKLDLVVGGQTVFNTTYISYYGGSWEIPNFNGYVNVIIGNGNGTFGTVNAYLNGGSGSSSSISLADFNNDNNLDVFTGQYQRSVRLGNGNGTLQSTLASPYFDSTNVVIGDFDNDGKADLVGSNGGLLFAKGKGNGTFEEPVYLGVGQTRSVVAGDVNADGKLDLIVSTQQTTFGYYGPYGAYYPTTTDYTKVLLGYGDGTFALPHTTTLASHDDYGAPNLSTSGDLNGDALPDLVATDISSNMFVQINQADWVLPGILTISDATVTEGHAGTVNATFTVTLAAAPASNVLVGYSTADGDATLLGGDYLLTSGTLTFTPGQTTKMITVPVKGDRIGETNEVFYVNLTNAINADLIDAQGVGTIIDDEPRVSINNASVTEGNSGTTPMNFTVTLSAPSDAISTVNFSTASGSAISGNDFDATFGSVTFMPGETSKTVSVAVRGDVIDEENETFSVNLSGASNAFILNDVGTGTINDNDAAPSIVINDVSRAEGNSGFTPFTFRVSLLTPSEKYVYVQYATASGSATSATQGNKQDYQPSSGYVYIYPGQTSATVTANGVGDTRNESDETFFVNLSNASNGTITDAQGVGTILNDENGRGKKWIGPATGGSWSTAANWSPSGVPGTGSIATIDNASVALSASATIVSLELSGGASLAVASNSGRVLRATSLFIDGNSKLNLNDNSMIIDSASIDDVTNYFASGYANGAWNGVGLNSSTAAATPRGALGGARASDVFSTFPATFQGQSVSAANVLIRYTLTGDANLDGKVNGLDFNAVAANFNQNVNRWNQGNFNYDGRVNALDFNVLTSRFGDTLASPGSALSPGNAILGSSPAGISLFGATKNDDELLAVV